MGLNAFQIALLAGCVTLDGAAWRADGDPRFHRARRFRFRPCQVLDVRLIEREMHLRRGERSTGRLRVKVFQHLTRRLHRAFLADDAEHIAAIGDLDTQTAFKLAQVLVKLAAQGRQPLIIGGFEGNIAGFR